MKNKKGELITQAEWGRRQTPPISRARVAQYVASGELTGYTSQNMVFSNAIRKHCTRKSGRPVKMYGV